MWRTPLGIRKLAGRERALVVVAVAHLSDELDEGNEGDEPTGVEVFDHLPTVDRPCRLLEVARCLLGDEPPPKLLAWNESAVLAIYESIKANIAVEADLARECGRVRGWNFWRTLVLSAWQEKCWNRNDKSIPWGKDQGPRQAVGSSDLDEWKWKVECLADRVLHDRDCEDEVVLDSRPAVAGMIHAELGIDDDYFTAIPPLFSKEEIRRLEKFQDQLGGEADKKYRILCPAKRRTTRTA